jgi:diaminopimelate epimerase
MRLKFTKMQGAGNDFVVIDGVTRRIELSREQVRRIADRHFGVGCDQLLLVEPPESAGADFCYRIFNADGGEVEQCGNGARCFVRFVHDHGLTDKTEIRVDTLSGRISPRLEPSGEVTVNMGAPVFDPPRIPYVPPSGSPDVDPGVMAQPLEVGGETVRLSVLSMGNPHAVQFVADIDAAPVASQGPLIENHPRFPKRVNAGYMQVLDRHRARLRVWERGAGETLACGTGACAAVVAGIRRGLLESPVQVSTRGGDLTIRWDGGDNAPTDKQSNNAPTDVVWMTGPAATVFEGEMELDECR